MLINYFRKCQILLLISVIATCLFSCNKVESNYTILASIKALFFSYQVKSKECNLKTSVTSVVYPLPPDQVFT